MKRYACALLATAALTGCSSPFKGPGVEGAPITAITSQRLTNIYEGLGIKVGYDCKFMSGMISDSTCVRGDINWLESTAVATSNGNSEFVRNHAIKIASDKAKAQIRHFINESVHSQRVTSTMARAVEKANDNMKARIKTDEIVVTDNEAIKDGNLAVRENVNETVRTMTESIRVEAQGILRGVRVVESKIVDKQTIAVTVRWDRETDRAAQQLHMMFR